jgi:adenylate kinase family enzyme
VRRVSLVGCPGSGKTRTAQRLSALLDVPRVELDAIHHLPGWQPIERDEFRRRVAEVCTGDGWVIDGNYSAVRDLVLARADTVVFLDLPRAVVMWHLARRSVRRMRSGEELWNGNREEWRRFLSFRRDENILRWAWSAYPKYRRRHLELVADPSMAHIRVARLRSHREIDVWLANVGSFTGPR